MEKFKKLNIDIISNEMEQIYGISKCKDVILDYLQYAELKQNNEISGVGNFNISIRCAPRYDVVKLIDLICKILNVNNIVTTSYIELQEINLRKFKGLKDVEEDIIIIDTNKVDCNMRSNQSFLKDQIQNTNKIFIIIFNDDRPYKTNDYEKYLGEEFAWHLEIGDLTDNEKERYIVEKLKYNNIRVSKKCTLDKVLASKDIKQIESELLYIMVKCKARNTTMITNEFLSHINREQYVSKVKVTNTALKELDALEGLEDVKKQIHSIFNYIRTCKARDVSLPSLHMTFNGPSGVGKTSLARIVGKLFAEEQLLSNENKYTEVHARDLVGQYVGWTSKKVKEIVTKAEGGVLFIDEAYSLCSDRKSFEQEAIDTLIAEMENKRDRLCIILAGYPDEMKELLAMNKGLASRINFHINFESLTPEHLYNIVRTMFKNDGYKLAKNIKPLLLDYFNIEKSKDTFSNGRLARNIADHLKIQQANRVMLEPNADINVITKTDVENVLKQIQQQEPKPKNKIGFAS